MLDPRFKMAADPTPVQPIQPTTTKDALSSPAKISDANPALGSAEIDSKKDKKSYTLPRGFYETKPLPNQENEDDDSASKDRETNREIGHHRHRKLMDDLIALDAVDPLRGKQQEQAIRIPTSLGGGEVCRDAYTEAMKDEPIRDGNGDIDVDQMSEKAKEIYNKMRDHPRYKIDTRKEVDEFNKKIAIIVARDLANAKELDPTFELRPIRKHKRKTKGTKKESESAPKDYYWLIPCMLIATLAVLFLLNACGVLAPASYVRKNGESMATGSAFIGSGIHNRQEEPTRNNGDGHIRVSENDVEERGENRAPAFIGVKVKNTINSPDPNRISSGHDTSNLDYVSKSKAYGSHRDRRNQEYGDSIVDVGTEQVKKSKLHIEDNPDYVREVRSSADCKTMAEWNAYGDRIFTGSNNKISTRPRTPFASDRVTTSIGTDQEAYIKDDSPKNEARGSYHEREKQEYGNSIFDIGRESIGQGVENDLKEIVAEMRKQLKKDDELDEYFKMLHNYIETSDRRVIQGPVLIQHTFKIIMGCILSLFVITFFGLLIRGICLCFRIIGNVVTFFRIVCGAIESYVKEHDL